MQSFGWLNPLPHEQKTVADHQGQRWPPHAHLTRLIPVQTLPESQLAYACGASLLAWLAILTARFFASDSDRLSRCSFKRDMRSLW